MTASGGRDWILGKDVRYRSAMTPRMWLSLLIVGLGLAACVGPEEIPELLPFVDSVERPAARALLSAESDGITIDVYSEGGCATIVEFVPEYGYLVDEFCPSSPTPSPFGAQFSTPKCPVIDFGDECGNELPTYVIGRTVDAAAFVCVVTGRVEVREGWWLAANDEVQEEVFPMGADGTRLDSVANELDDQMRAKCDISDPVLDAAVLEIRPTGYQLPITVEIDHGTVGSFLLREGFEPFTFTTALPVAAGPMFINVIEGAEGRGIGEVAVPEPPGCDDPVFVLDLAGPSGEWSCDG